MVEARDIQHGEYTWHYEKADLEQGAYYVADPDGQKTAVILPSNRAQPIEQARNARLLIRDFGSTEWKDQGVYALKEAMARGNDHIHRYRSQDQAAYTAKQIAKEGLTAGERGLVDRLRGRDPPQHSEPARPQAAPDRPGAGQTLSDEGKPSAWERIREAKKRRENEKSRGRYRDAGRERE